MLNALHNLCKINKRRQEQAAECGIIPHLMYFIKINSSLKQFALPLLCDMAHASRTTRYDFRLLPIRGTLFTLDFQALHISTLPHVTFIPKTLNVITY